MGSIGGKPQTLNHLCPQSGHLRSGSLGKNSAEQPSHVHLLSQRSGSVKSAPTSHTNSGRGVAHSHPTGDPSSHPLALSMLIVGGIIT